MGCASLVPEDKIVTKASYTRACRMVRKPNACMCGWDCKPALRRPRMVRIPFAEPKLVGFLHEHKENWMCRVSFPCTRCPFHAPGVLCSPQVYGNLINHAPNTCRMRTVQHVSRALVYTTFNDVYLQVPILITQIFHNFFF